MYDVLPNEYVRKEAKMKKMNLISICCVILVVLAGLVTPAPAQGEIVTSVIYDNTTTWVGTIVPCVVCEMGDEITLAGTQRIVTDFMFGYYGVFTPDGDETARIRFYANDGPEEAPGTLLYDSGTFPIMPGYDQTHTLTGLFVIVPDTFTWTCQFGGVTQWPYDLAALYLYDPPSVGSSEDYLWKSEGSGWNEWNSTSVDNLMARVTGVEELSPEEEIARILDFFDTSVESETLEGDGTGNSAEKRLNALRNMIEAARDLIAAGDIDAACQQLQDVYNRTDGETPPPDFVTGEAASELATMILELMAEIGC